MSTAAHQETEGQTERVNRVLEGVLRIYSTSFKSCSSFLPMVEFALNNVEHWSAGRTPIYVNYSRHPRIPALLVVERSRSTNEISDAYSDAGPSASPDSMSTLYTSASAVLKYPREDGRGSSHIITSTLLNRVMNRTAAKTAVQGVRTRAAIRRQYRGLQLRVSPRGRHRHIPREPRRRDAP
ncbi:hypothetical protein JG688_00017512 [Phytophthora aleatoria]|uniref:Integrase catalytic domain-containing protein n=1 Tax=Phytophthora aleatoria TaxID=2496075 RepID=A0A8J5IX37_9STRA|nr:hypothetical protein JG688_00017512 [Phytophthora aleatoria]